MTQLTRRERQAQTRAKLLESAATVFARSGYRGAAVADIAKEAGVSTGALYANFAGKEDLFFTLMDERMREQATERLQRAAAASGAGDDPVRAAAAAWVEFLDTEPEAFLLLLEFWVHAQRDPETRGRVAARLGEVRDGLRALIAAAAGEQQADVATTVQALAYGFALLHLSDPERVSGAQLVAALELLRRGATPARGRS